MHWNHRVIRHPDSDGGEFFTVAEVFYDDEGRPAAWAEAGEYGESVPSLRLELERMAAACDLPVLDEEVDFVGDLGGADPKGARTLAEVMDSLGITEDELAEDPR